jgi:hypothetical protein
MILEEHRLGVSAALFLSCRISIQMKPFFLVFAQGECNVLFDKFINIIVRYMDCFVRCDSNDPERMITYDLAMLVSVLCCGRYACANVRAQTRAITIGWEGTPVGFYGERQMRAGVNQSNSVFKSRQNRGWANAQVFCKAWIDSANNSLGLPAHDTCLASLLLTCPATSCHAGVWLYRSRRFWQTSKRITPENARGREGGGGGGERLDVVSSAAVSPPHVPDWNGAVRERRGT